MKSSIIRYLKKNSGASRAKINLEKSNILILGNDNLYQNEIQQLGIKIYENVKKKSLWRKISKKIQYFKMGENTP